MKKLLFIAFSILLTTSIVAQDALTYYTKAIEKAKEEKFVESIDLFNKSIKLQPEVYSAWFNRGIAFYNLDLYELALADFNETIRLKPDFKNAYLLKAMMLNKLTDYQGAIDEYTKAIEIDLNYSQAYFNRGLIYELQLMKELACADFHKALTLGLELAERKTTICKDTTPTNSKQYALLKLTKLAPDKTYGFSEKHPIKVGQGPSGTTSNQHMYLSLLRDVNGNVIHYKRLGSCCGYPSENAIIGNIALIDQYEIYYYNKKGKQQKDIIYISLYDYEEPMIISGFSTVGLK